MREVIEKVKSKFTFINTYSNLLNKIGLDFIKKKNRPHISIQYKIFKIK